MLASELATGSDRRGQGRGVPNRRPLCQGQGCAHRRQPDLATADVAEAAFLMQRRLAYSLGHEMHEPYGFGQRAAAWSGEARARDGNVRVGMEPQPGL